MLASQSQLTIGNSGGDTPCELIEVCQLLSYFGV
jgi:hypothetical protein